MSHGIGYSRALAQLESASSIAVLAGYSTMNYDAKSRITKYSITYFYAGTDEVFGLLEVETLQSGRGEIQQIGTVQFSQLQ